MLSRAKRKESRSPSCGRARLLASVKAKLRDPEKKLQNDLAKLSDSRAPLKRTCDLTITRSSSHAQVDVTSGTLWQTF